TSRPAGPAAPRSGSPPCAEVRSSSTPYQVASAASSAASTQTYRAQSNSASCQIQRASPARCRARRSAPVSSSASSAYSSMGLSSTPPSAHSRSSMGISLAVAPLAPAVAQLQQRGLGQAQFDGRRLRLQGLYQGLGRSLQGLAAGRCRALSQQPLHFVEEAPLGLTRRAGRRRQAGAQVQQLVAQVEPVEA